MQHFLVKWKREVSYRLWCIQKDAFHECCSKYISGPFYVSILKRSLATQIPFSVVYWGGGNFLDDLAKWNWHLINSSKLVAECSSY